MNHRMALAFLHAIDIFHRNHRRGQRWQHKQDESPLLSDFVLDVIGADNLSSLFSLLNRKVPTITTTTTTMAGGDTTSFVCDSFNVDMDDSELSRLFGDLDVADTS